MIVRIVFIVALFLPFRVAARDDDVDFSQTTGAKPLAGNSNDKLITATASGKHF
ncbi:hypothetical protein [Methylotuvimicrobium alcaliphilum]|uniref:hypothetical protein n=1 Tax=Methylotuvimicrobium alcaliphilum TaxID=271065 RepID=UPI0002EF589C|nr:hypothetical protein [Methylotuvimicrobium alcaliphilum]